MFHTTLIEEASEAQSTAEAGLAFRGGIPPPAGARQIYQCTTNAELSYL